MDKDIIIFLLFYFLFSMIGFLIFVVTAERSLPHPSQSRDIGASHGQLAQATNGKGKNGSGEADWLELSFQSQSSDPTTRIMRSCGWWKRNVRWKTVGHRELKTLNCLTG